MKRVFFSYLFVVGALIGYAYQMLPDLYYLNDEWKALADIYTNGVFGALRGFAWTELLLGKGRLLGAIVQHSLFQYFPLEALPFAVVSWIFHFANAVLVYLLVSHFTKSRFVAYVSGVFFVSASVYYQVFAWIATPVQVSLSTFFVLLSLLFIIWYSKKNKWYFVLLSVLSGYIAFLFKDSAYYVFLLLPVTYILVTPEGFSFWPAVRKFFPLLGIAAIIAVSRFPMILEMAKIPFQRDGTTGMLGRIIFNSFFYPLMSLSQTIIPVRYMNRLAEAFGKFYYPQLLPHVGAEDILNHFIFPDMIGLGVSFLILFCIVLSYYDNVKNRRLLLFGGFFLVLSFIPVSAYLFERGSSYIESRYFYTVALSVGIFIAVLCDSIRRVIAQKNDMLYRGVTVMLLFLVFGYCVKQAAITRREVYANVIQGEEIKDVLMQMKALYPVLPQKPIIYMTGDADFFGYPHHPVPLQLGVGFMIALWYYPDGIIPTAVVQNKYLMRFGSQGYQEDDDKGFGYFWDMARLEDTIMKEHVPMERIIGIYYDSRKKQLIDVTPELKKEIRDTIGTPL